MPSSLPRHVIPPPRQRTDWRTYYLTVAALAYAVFGVVAMFAFAPHVPYADQLRSYAFLLGHSFPGALFVPDNGHVEILANLLRSIELRWFGGQEILQIAGGAILAAGSLLVLLDVLRRDRGLPPFSRAAAAFALAFGIFWLVNARALTQGNFSVDVYGVILCLALALRLAVAEQTAVAHQRRTIIVAIVLCAIAALSFGSGIAAFAALIAVLFVQRASAQQLLLPLAGLACVLMLYFALAGTAQGTLAGTAAPSIIVRQAMQWLGAPFVYLFWPLLDPTAAAAVPGPVGAIAVGIAGAWTRHFGDIHLNAFPQAACGVAVVLLLLLATFRLRRIGAKATGSARMGIGLAWFGVGVALLVAITRQAYFAEHPDQIYAPRYLPWSILCWAGVLLAFVANARTSRVARTLAMILPLLALPAEFGMTLVARHMREVAEDSALAATVGVLPDQQNLGETDIDDLRAALPPLRAAQVAMFAWPESALLGRSVPAASTLLTASQIESDPVANRLDGEGSRISALLTESVGRCSRVMVATDGAVIGLLRQAPDGRWRGVARGYPDSTQLHFVTLCTMPPS